MACSRYKRPAGNQFRKIMAIPPPVTSHSWKRALISSAATFKVATLSRRSPPPSARSRYEAISFKLTDPKRRAVKTRTPPGVCRHSVVHFSLRVRNFARESRFPPARNVAPFLLFSFLPFPCFIPSSFFSSNFTFSLLSVLFLSPFSLVSAIVKYFRGYKGDNKAIRKFKERVRCARIQLLLSEDYIYLNGVFNVKFCFFECRVWIR